MAERNRRANQLEFRKKVAEREFEFRGRGNQAAGYAEKRFEMESRSQAAHWTQPPPVVAQEEFPQQVSVGRKVVRRFTEDDKNVVKRCIRCVIDSPYINNAGVFKSRIGFHRGDVRRLYEALCHDESDWARHDGASNTWFLINNCMHEIIRNNICQEWSRWFGNVSRRRAEDLYDRLGGPGKVLQRYNGRIVELPTPRHAVAAVTNFGDHPHTIC